MSDNNNNNPNLLKLNVEDLDSVTGGISDHSTQCGNAISTRCGFCIHQKHGQFTFDGVLHDTIGCQLSSCPVGSIDGWVLAIKAAGPTPTHI